MIIPDKIRIGGQEIRVVKEERLDDNKLGTICVAEGVLRIADNFNKIGKKSPRSSASVDELSLNFLEFSFAVSKIIIIFVA